MRELKLTGTCHCWRSRTTAATGIQAGVLALQVHKLQETSVMQLDHMRSLQQKLNAARAEVGSSTPH